MYGRIHIILLYLLENWADFSLENEFQSFGNKSGDKLSSLYLILLSQIINLFYYFKFRTRKMLFNNNYNCFSSLPPMSTSLPGVKVVVDMKENLKFVTRNSSAVWCYHLSSHLFLKVTRPIVLLKGAEGSWIIKG